MAGNITALAYERAFAFAARFQREGYYALSHGRLQVDRKNIRGDFGVCFPAGDQSPPGLAPLIVKCGVSQRPPQHVFLQAEGEPGKYSLAAFIQHNSPTLPLPPTVTTLEIQALSPTEAFWLQWIDRSSHPLQGILVKERISYQKKLIAGANEFREVTCLAVGFRPTRPFAAPSPDMAGKIITPELLRLFLVPESNEADIIEIRLTAQSSRLGNFSLLI